MTPASSSTQINPRVVASGGRTDGYLITMSISWEATDIEQAEELALMTNHEIPIISRKIAKKWEHRE